jgi:hypothetical protein
VSLGIAFNTLLNLRGRGVSDGSRMLEDTLEPPRLKVIEINSIGGELRPFLLDLELTL